MKFISRFFYAFVVIIILFALLYLSSVYYLGIKAQDSINREIALLRESSLIEVTGYHYHRGWFRSEAEATVRLRPSVLKTIHIGRFPSVLKLILQRPVHLKTRIWHGPLAHHQLLRAYAATEVVFEQQAEREIIKFFAIGRPFHIQDTIHLSGAGKVDFTLGSVDYKELSGIQIRFAGLWGELSYQKDYKEYVWHLKVPKFFMRLADKGGVLLSDVRYSSSNTPHADAIDTGVTNFSVDHILASTQLQDKIHLNLASLLSLFTNTKLGDFFDPGLSFRLSDLELRRLQLQTDISKDKDFIAMQGQFGLQALRLNDTWYGPIRLTAAAKHLHALSLKQLREFLAQLNSEPIEANIWQDKLLAFVRTKAYSLFTQGPQFEITELYGKFPSGEIKAQGNLSLKGLRQENLSNFTALMNHAQAHVTYQIPMEIAVDIFEKQVIGLLLSANGAVGDPKGLESVAKTARYLATSTINDYVGRHYLTLNQGILNGQIDWQGGKLLLNTIPYHNEVENIDQIYTPEDEKELEGPKKNLPQRQNRSILRGNNKKSVPLKRDAK